MRKLADTAYWVYSAAAAGSLSLTVLVLMRSIGGFDSALFPSSSGFTNMELALILTGLTLAFGLFFAMPMLRRVNAEQVVLTDRTAELELAAHTDPLTGLYNRRYLEDALREYWAEFRGSSAALAFLTLDIDHFKLINDTHGHDAGDQVLKQFADKLRDLTRDYDVVARTGGEEFSIIAPFPDRSQIIPFAERLCEMIGVMCVKIDGDMVKLTVSIGVASSADGFANEQALLKRSDELLYEAKRSGRNRVVAQNGVT